MAAFFLDATTVLKRYVQETGTAWVQALAAPLRLSGIRYLSCGSRWPRRSPPSRGGSVAARLNHAAGRRHRRGGFPARFFARQYRVVEVSAGLVAQAATLARRHALRGYDAVQLAAALETHATDSSLTLLSADAELNTAATAEGLSVEDPNSHP